MVTGMSDEVSWGVYIANFTFLVGVAAAAVMMVIPVYIYNNEELHDLVIFGELLAVAAIIMCLLFVTVDLGRPDRFWHLIPGLGQFNFPASMLSWDVIVLNGYLVLKQVPCSSTCSSWPTKCSKDPLRYLGLRPFVLHDFPANVGPYPARAALQSQRRSASSRGPALQRHPLAKLVPAANFSAIFSANSYRNAEFSPKSSRRKLGNEEFRDRT